MCSEILDLIKQRDYYLKKFKQTKSSIDLAQHHTLRNQVTQHIRKAKAHFIKDSVEENKGNPKQLWRVMQDLGCSKKCKTKETNIGINNDDSVCFDKGKVATHFNNFLVILLKTWLGGCLQLLANMDMILLKISTKRKSAQLGKILLFLQ